MLLAAESHKRLERFFREHFDDPTLRLPPIHFYYGRVARWFVGGLRQGAITFGRRIFVLPRLIERDEQGRLIVPGWLAVHEATHVLQYERAGFVGFLVLYLGGYWRALRSQKRLSGAAHWAAYRAIREEREAEEAEEAYANWSKHLKALDEAVEK
jgi:hypothetical protein